jgi:hypothetical protein
MGTAITLDREPQRRAAELDARIAELQQLRGELDRLARRAATLDPKQCPPEAVCHVIADNPPAASTTRGSRRRPRSAYLETGRHPDGRTRLDQDQRYLSQRHRVHGGRLGCGRPDERSGQVMMQTVACSPVRARDDCRAHRMVWPGWRPRVSGLDLRRHQPLAWLLAGLTAFVLASAPSQAPGGSLGLAVASRAARCAKRFMPSVQAEPRQRGRRHAAHPAGLPCL